MTSLDLDRPSFISRSERSDELRQEIRKLWQNPRIRRKVFIELFSKIPVAFGLMLGCYAALISGWITGIWVVLALGGITIGAIVMGGIFHDANHRAIFTRLGLPRTTDGLFAWVVSDVMLGISGYFWSWKHDLHHTEANILHLDQDIRGEPFMRLHPGGKAGWVYRYQHIYVWFLYPFLVFALQLQGHKIALFGGDYGPKRHKPRAQGWKFKGAIVGPVLFYTWALAIPAIRFSWDGVLGFAVVMGAVGFAYTLIFQLAHCNDAVEFPTVAQLKAGPRKEVFVHQLETSTDFSLNNWLLAYLFGNLTHQNEHHATRDYPHPFYRYMAPVLQRWCRKYAVTYNVKPTLWSAVGSHVRHLRKVGAMGLFAEFEMG